MTVCSRSRRHRDRHCVVEMDHAKSSREHVVVPMEHCNEASEVAVLHRRHSKVLQQHSVFRAKEGVIPFADAVFDRDEVVILERPAVCQIDDDASSPKHSKSPPRLAVLLSEHALCSAKLLRSVRDESKSHRNQKEYLSNLLCLPNEPSLSLRDQGAFSIEPLASQPKPKVIHEHSENIPSFHRACVSG